MSLPFLLLCQIGVIIVYKRPAGRIRPSGFGESEQNMLDKFSVFRNDFQILKNDFRTGHVPVLSIASTSKRAMPSVAESFCAKTFARTNLSGVVCKEQS